MNITLLTQYYKPEMGAPQNRLFEMVTGLRDRGCNVSVITAMPNYPTGKIHNSYRGKFSVNEIIDDICIKRYWLYASNSKNTFPRIISMLSFSFISLLSFRFIKKQKSDILIVESPPLTLGLTGYILAMITGAKLVMNISDLWPLSAKELGAISDGFAYRGLERLECFLYRKSKLCLGQSQEIVDYIKSHRATDTYLFRNGVNPSRFIKHEQHNTNGKFKILYAGLLGVAQGISKICENVNFKELDAEFHIYGAGSEQIEVERYIEGHKNQGIFYHGIVSRDDIPKILSTANATLIPLVKNIYGAVPSKIYESMAASVPILFSGEGEGAKIIIENGLGLVSLPSDFEKLKQNIKQMSHSSIDYKQMKDRCIIAANEKFNRPKQIDSLLKKLKQI